MKTIQKCWTLLVDLTALGLIGFALVSLLGCDGTNSQPAPSEKKEKILDIKTPDTDVEVEKSEKGLDINIKEKRPDSSASEEHQQDGHQHERRPDQNEAEE